MAQWTTGEVIANGIRLHYTRTGGNKPPIVLAHGFSDSGLCWSAFAQALEDDYDLVMYDTRGHGLSDSPDNGHAPLIQAQDCAGLIAALELDKPVVIGHSMGALMALFLAATHPDAVSAVILEDPPAGWEPNAGRRVLSEEEAVESRRGFDEWIAKIKSKTRQELIDDQRAQEPRWAEAELGPWADAKIHLHQNALTYVVVGDEPDFSTIQLPLLLIIGDKECGAIVSPEQAVALQQIVPHARVAQIPEAGHCIRRDQPSAYERVVRSFLSALGPKSS
jgi:N-formylmaleamate deformylase